jgi:hypothetical protein
MRIITILLFTIFLSYSCKNSPTIYENKIFDKKEMIIGDTSEGWGGDIRLSIVQIQQKENGVKILTAISSYKGTDVGFNLEVSPKEKTDSEFQESGLVIKSIGNPSNALLLSLADIYSIKQESKLEFIDSLSTTFVDLNKMATKIGKSENAKVEPVKDILTKLFLGDSNDEKTYGEIYLNFNEQERWVELKEKDIEYRSAVIKALSKKIKAAHNIGFAKVGLTIIAHQP